MVPSRFDLKMKWRHVVEEARFHEVVGISARVRAMKGRTIKEASDGPYGLQEGRHAQVVECYCRLLSISQGASHFQSSACGRKPWFVR
jgi:hypothetical protein